MRLGHRWALFEPFGQPAFVGPFTDPDGRVGTHFFEEWAKAHGWTLGPDWETPGLFEHLEDLSSDVFDPSAVHDLVRRLYETTKSTEFRAERPRWTPAGWVIHTLYNRLIAHKMRQLNAPLREDAFPTEIHSEISPLHRDPKERAPYRAWVRTYSSIREIFYTAAVSPVRTSGWYGTQSYLVAILPLWRASLTVVFQPANLPNGGFEIDSVQPRTYLGGTYLVVPGRKRFAMMPAFVRDQIRLHPRRDENGEYLEGEHNTWAGPIHGYTIPYTIRPKAGHPLTEAAREKTAAQDAQRTKEAAAAAAAVSSAATMKTREKASVVVIGGGPAGFAAASALARRGIDVLLVERESSWGGKAYTTRKPGEPPKGHGVHGWWPSYRNFDRLLVEAGIEPEDVLRRAHLGGVLLGSGAMANLRNAFVLLPSPLHLFSSLRELGLANFTEIRSLLRYGIHALAFDHERDYGRYDGLSLAEFARRCGVSRNAMELMLAPFSLSFDYAPPGIVSASSILSAMQFYMLPSATAMEPRWCRGLEHERIFEPLAASITAAGGRAALSTSVESIAIEGGKVVAVNLVSPLPAGRLVELGVVPESALPAEGLPLFPSATGESFFAGRIGGKVCAFSSRCPHQGSTIRARHEGEGPGFVCDFHRSFFKPDGSRESGPTTRGMDPLPCTSGDGGIHVSSDKARVSVDCEHAIVATSVSAARALLDASDQLAATAANPDAKSRIPASLKDNLAKLRTTPVIVVRIWLKPDAPVPADRESIVLPHGEFADVFFHLNALGQARSADNVVVEVHCAAAGDKAHWQGNEVSDAEILAAALRDISRIAPELRGSDLDPALEPEIQRHMDTFTLYAPGDAARRPGAESGIPGLLLAGDWTSADWSVWMAERAVASGLRAANSVLAGLGLAPAPIERLPAEGPLLKASRAVARALRYVLGGI